MNARWPFQLQITRRYCQCISKSATLSQPRFARSFRTSRSFAAVRPFLLSDPGEGIKEVQIIQWFVQPGARVEQFDKVCEVASDKANVEITSRFDGVIKKLHYEQDDVVQVGQSLFDIDVQSEISPEDEAVLAPEPQQAGEPNAPQQPQKAAAQVYGAENRQRSQRDSPSQRSNGEHPNLATPAVRGLLKQHDIDISKLEGTGRDGRILKEDVHKYLADKNAASTTTSSPSTSAVDETQVEKPITLTNIQSQMFKTMTRSLSIPHFVYADEIDISSLKLLRSRLNAPSGQDQKLSYLHFIIKAVSLALHDFPLLNSRVEAGDEHQKTQLIMREKHNIGVAMDTSQGLLVPNIKNVAARSISEIATECTRLQQLAKESKLSAKDLTGGTITVSNIGSIGGTYVAPVIVQSEVAILGLGKARTVPAFGDDGAVRRKEIMNFSWSADHRVVDGATMARMAERVKTFVEAPDTMIARLR